jgi:NAD(P) transhydrogenase subunit alpha
VVTTNGVRILGHANVAGRLPASASALYSRNLLAFVETMIDKTSQAVSPNWDDELIKATLLTHDGQVVHPNFKAA